MECKRNSFVDSTCCCVRHDRGARATISGGTIGALVLLFSRSGTIGALVLLFSRSGTIGALVLLSGERSYDD